MVESLDSCQSKTITILSNTQWPHCERRGKIGEVWGAASALMLTGTLQTRYAKQATSKHEDDNNKLGLNGLGIST
jgi:hypothetical protein